MSGLIAHFLFGVNLKGPARLGKAADRISGQVAVAAGERPGRMRKESESEAKMASEAFFRAEAPLILRQLWHD